MIVWAAFSSLAGLPVAASDWSSSPLLSNVKPISATIAMPTRASAPAAMPNPEGFLSGVPVTGNSNANSDAGTGAGA